MSKIDFENIYLSNFNRIKFYAYYYLGDITEAENVAQDTFVVLWNNMAKIHPEEDIFPYLTVVTRNLCVNILRKRESVSKFKSYSYYHNRDTIANAALSDSTSTSLYSKEMSNILRVAIDNMPHKVKSTFLKCRFDGLKYEEIAYSENVSVKAIEYRMSSALRILRTYLKDYIVATLLLIQLIINRL